MPYWPWFDRTFSFDYPPEKMPDLLERLRGTPARLEERICNIPRAWMTRPSAGGGWTIQQNVGHLTDLATMPRRRLDQILAGEPTLAAADLTNRKTNEANHNGASIEMLVATFRRQRAELVAAFEALPESAWGLSSMHPRLGKPMRIVDLVCFDCEHDDYHLARIAARLREFQQAK